MKRPPCFGIAGWKNSGKTTLVSSLVAEITARGFAVSTIKHAHHSFDLDTPGTDSFRHREAGAQEVVLVSQNRWAIQHELNNRNEPTLADMLSRISPCDLVLVEGFKREAIPKIEIIGANTPHEFLWEHDANIKAIACDTKLGTCTLPQFTREQTSDIADFILKFCGISP